MSSERSSLLLHHPSMRQRSRNPPAHHGKKYGGIIRQNGPFNPPDLLDDSKYEARHTPQSHDAPRFVHSERRGMDQDIIQIEDDLPPLSVAFSSTSIQNLQRRKQARNQILAKANDTNGTIEHHIIFDDDEDDTDTDTDDETRKRNTARIRQLRSTPNNDVQLINLEETMPLTAHAHSLHYEIYTNGSVQNNTFPPLEGLTNE